MPYQVRRGLPIFDMLHSCFGAIQNPKFRFDRIIITTVILTLSPELIGVDVLVHNFD